jgi:hypothetical protein
VFRVHFIKIAHLAAAQKFQLGDTGRRRLCGHKNSSWATGQTLNSGAVANRQKLVLTMIDCLKEGGDYSASPAACQAVVSRPSLLAAALG